MCSTEAPVQARGMALMSAPQAGLAEQEPRLASRHCRTSTSALPHRAHLTGLGKRRTGPSASLARATPTIHSSRWRMWAYSIVVLSLVARVASAGSIVSQTFVLDTSANQCTSCSPSDDVEALIAAAKTPSAEELGQWVQLHYPDNGEFGGGLGPAELLVSLAGQSINPDGWEFRIGANSLRFWLRECLLWDCYTPHLSLQAATGRTIWQRRVPFVSTPVFPFVIGKWLVYLGHRGKPEKLLVAVNLETGRPAGTYLIAKEPGVEYFNPPGCFPFYKSGFVVLQRTRVVGAHLAWQTECTPQTMLFRLALEGLP